MSRIGTTFKELKASGRKALIPYLTVGHPGLALTPALVQAVADAGADLVELGIPFSDPIADGPIIQRAAYEALRQGVNLQQCLAVAGKLRGDGLRIPLLFMGYYNPIFHYGQERFCQECQQVGVDGLIVPDLPPEEAGSLRRACLENGLDLIFLLAPTSTSERVELVASLASGFIYLVSLTGVTGPRDSLPAELEEFVARVRAQTSQPLCVGFGVSGPQQARRIGEVADGVVVGSAIVRLAGESEPLGQVSSFVGQLRRGLDGR
jgi:tryptophan synthase alpha chain